MATSALLRLTLQAYNTNQDTWGQILNDSVFQLLEDAVAGAATITLIGEANKTLTDLDGADAESRYAILDIGGTSATPTATNIVVPTRSKIYLAVNGADNPVVVKTAAGTGPTLPVGEAQWVFCDGTNVLAASAATATSAGTAATATNALALIGVAGADFAQKGLAQTFTKGQLTQRVTVSSSLGNLQINCADSNAFKMTTSESFTLLAPQNATDGQQFTLAIKQGGGGPHTIAFAANTFAAANATAPVLSTTADDVDYLAFEYCTTLFNGTDSRWIVSILKDIGDL